MPMRFWLVQTGEELPLDGPKTRLLRTAILAEELCARGHEVIYINASFNHQQKRQRNKRTTIIAKNPFEGRNYDSVLLAGTAYRKNVSVGRLVSHMENAASFDAIAPSLPRPNAILCGFPPIELAERTAKFAQRNQIPCAMDCRDMWPEVIEERMPRPLRLLARFILLRMMRQKRVAMSGATAITGITDQFVDWGLEAAGRTRQPMDRAFHLAVSPTPLDSEALRQADNDWSAQLGVANRANRRPIIGCFVGTLALRTDLLTIVDGANLLNEQQRKALQIVICGKGDLEAELAKRCAGNPAIILAGWQSAPKIAALMARSSFGILPYPNTSDFLASFPNKVGEYLMAGLPIMSGLAGVTGTLLAQNALALHYQVGSPQSVADRFGAIIATGADPAVHQRAAALGAAHFNPDHIYPDFADWLEQLAERNSAKSTKVLTV